MKAQQKKKKKVNELFTDLHSQWQFLKWSVKLKFKSNRMPNAQVITEGFLLHALGLNYRRRRADTETYDLHLNITSFILTILTRCVTSFSYDITARDWGLCSVTFQSLCWAASLTSPYPPRWLCGCAFQVLSFPC